MIKCYKNVYSRNEFKPLTVSEFFTTPVQAFETWGYTEDEAIQLTKELPLVDDKKERSKIKRELFPAVTLFDAGFMAIDIDNISDKPNVKFDLINILKNDKQVFLIQDSVSSNLVIYYKTDCEKKDFQYLYYKKYLELTLLLGITIDYLPEPDRFRYVSLGKVHYHNEDSEVVTELLKVDKFIIPAPNGTNVEEYDSLDENKPKPVFTLIPAMMEGRVFKSTK